MQDLSLCGHQPRGSLNTQAARRSDPRDCFSLQESCLSHGTEESRGLAASTSLPVISLDSSAFCQRKGTISKGLWTPAQGKCRQGAECSLCSYILLLQHPKAGNLSRLMVTENLTKKKLYKGKNLRRKLFPPTQIISKAILKFPAWGSNRNMVREFSKCLMGLNV